MIRYGNKILKYKKNFKFLGLHFDSPRLNWDTQINELIKNCNNRLNLLKAVSAKTWGADRETLLHLYKALFRSKIDYGCMAYSSASNTNIKKLEVVQNTAIRIATGCLKSTPTVALRCETNLPPIENKIEIVTLNYFIKTKYFNNENPIQTEILQQTDRLNNITFNGNKSPAINRATYAIRKLSVPNINITPFDIIPPIPPWAKPTVTTKTELITKTSKNMPNKILKEIVNITINQN